MALLLRFLLGWLTLCPSQTRVHHVQPAWFIAGTLIQSGRRWIQEITNIATVGCGTLKDKLIKRVGVREGSLKRLLYDKLRIHHLIPVKVAEDFAEFFEKIGFHLNHPSNGMLLPGDAAAAKIFGIARHAGGHRGYNEAVNDAIFRVQSQYRQAVEQLTGSNPPLVGAPLDRAMDAIVQRAQHSCEQISKRCRDELRNGASIVSSTDLLGRTQDELKVFWLNILGGLP